MWIVELNTVFINKDEMVAMTHTFLIVVFADISSSQRNREWLKGFHKEIVCWFRMSNHNATWS